MSADNTILVIKTKRTALEIAKGVWQNGNENYVYRVAHVQAADNLSYYKTRELYNLGAYLYDTFKDSPVFHTEEDALAYADKLELEYEFVEYGCNLEDLSEYVFWSDR